MQWGITRGVSQEPSLPRKGLLKKMQWVTYLVAQLGDDVGDEVRVGRCEERDVRDERATVRVATFSF